MSKRFMAPLALAASGLLMAPALLAADESEETFLKETIGSNLAEIQLGRLAGQKASNEEVRDFGQQLVEDHTKALETARGLADENGIQAPSAPPPAEQAKYQELSQLSGSEFDQQFVSHMVQAHEKNVAKFEQQAEGDSDIAQYAEETLPTLERHLQHAEHLEDSERQSRE